MKVISALKTSSALTYPEGVEKFLFAASSRNLTQGSRDWYKFNLRAFERFLEQWGKSVSLQDITGQDILEFLVELLEQKKSAGRADYTVRRHYDALKIFFGFLHKENILFLNPMANIQPPRTSKRQRQPLTQDEVSRLLNAPNKKTFCGFRDYLLIVLFLDTGLRLNEALELKLSDVNFQEGTLLAFGKGRKERKVPFGQTLRGLLTTYLQRRGSIPGQELVFVNRFGQKLANRRVQDYFKQYARKADIQKPVHPHILRHTFALNFILQGGNPFVLQEILGHTTLDMTRKYVSLANQSFTGNRVSFMDKLAESGQSALPKRRLF